MYCVAQCSCPPTEWLWLAPTAPTCQASDATCRHHTDLHCSHTVGINNTHIRWNQVFVVWPSYVSVQNKFVWVWSPLMNAKMLHVRFVRPWWDSTDRSIYKECVNILWLQSTLNSNLCTHGVCTKQVVTWCDFVLFCHLIILKQRGFTQKNGVLKKKTVQIDTTLSSDSCFGTCPHWKHVNWYQFHWTIFG